VALGAALLGDSLNNLDSVTLIDALSMPIGFALPNGQFRVIVEKNSRIPLVKSFRLPAPKEPGAPFIEMELFQGDSSNIVDNEFLGTLKVPASSAGSRVDFRLDQECLLKVVVEDPTGPREITLATRDTPETLKKMLEEQRRLDEAERERLAQGGQPDASKGGLFSRFTKMFGRG
jgi:molecular chaperone DnaK